MKKGILLADTEGTTVKEVWDGQNKLFGYSFRNPIELAYGAGRALKMFQDSGLVITMAAGHSGVGRRYYTEDQMHEGHRILNNLLYEAFGIQVAAVGMCPHRPEDNCECRKPKTGMFTQIVEQLSFEVDLEKSVGVGDKPSDCQLARDVGIDRTILIEGGQWSWESLKADPPATVVVGSLLEAAYWHTTGKTFLDVM